MSKIKIIYDFIRFWIKWGDRKEAWEDAKFINDKEIQKELKEIEKIIGSNIEDRYDGQISKNK